MRPVVKEGVEHGEWRKRQVVDEKSKEVELLDDEIGKGQL